MLIRSSLLYVLVSSLVSLETTTTTAAAAASDRQQCDATGSCNGCATSTCLPASQDSSSVYRFGGTAQAYKTGTPTKSSICDKADVGPYRVATWPYRRAAYYASHKLPQILLSVNILSCGEPSSHKKSSSSLSSSCCCQPLNHNNQKVVATVQAWQTRPDGTYGSLQPGVQDDICRAQLQSNRGTFEFETYPPGSYGSLGGLGPNGWDFLPYGQPVIHFLVSSEDHAPTLVDVPISFDFATLEPKSSFGWADWRGPSWVRQKTLNDNAGYEIVSWKASPKQRSISIVLNVFVQTQSDSGTKTDTGPGEALCESSLYGLPSSFFREPMAVCGSSLLDFFAL